MQTPLPGRHVVFLSWRDTHNPEGGGAEVYLEKMAAGLVARGCRVTILCAAHAAAPPDQVVDGVRFVRRGGKLTVYLHGMRALARGDLGPVDLVVDVQNGLPFFSRLVTRRPVVVLVHHVHREQWPVVYPGITGRVGWWIERRVAPWLYRRCQYVAVSDATRSELKQLGVRGPRVAVVHNGTEPLVASSVGLGKSPTPMVAVVGRLVPHKQVEHAMDAVRQLRAGFPDLRLHVVGSGWWEEQLHDYATSTGVTEHVVFEGHVTDARKHEIYERSWVLALPSLKEGWGLVVSEAGMHGTPTVAYRSAGGTRESVADGESGLLVDGPEEFTATLGRLLADEALRGRLSAGAVTRSHHFTWDRAQESFAMVLAGVMAGGRTSAADPAGTEGADRQVSRWRRTRRTGRR